MARDWVSLEVIESALCRHWGVTGSSIAPLAQGAEGDAFLVTTGQERRVAKLVYHHRPAVEAAKTAAAIVGAAGLRTSTATSTIDGEQLAMVELPWGYQPLVLMTFVPGRPVDMSSPEVQRLIGSVTGRIHTALSDHMPDLPGSRDAFLSYVEASFEAAPPLAWLPPAIAAIVRDCRQLLDGLTYGPALWEGPEMLVDDDGTIGLIDWSNVGWQPLAMHVANQIGRASGWRHRGPAEIDERAAAAVLSGYSEERRLAPADLEALPLLIRVCAAVYAKFAATGTDRGQPSSAVEALKPLLLPG